MKYLVMVSAIMIFTSISNAQLKDSSPVISIDGLVRMLKTDPKAKIVDVRHERDFKAFRIPMSINIPLHAVKTSSFLRRVPVVLMNEGYGQERLIAECLKLRTRGFNAFVLHGGLNLWKKSGRRVTGDPFAMKDLNRVPPSVFHREIDLENRIIPDISTEPGQIPAGLKGLYREAPVGFPPFVFIIDEDGAAYGVLEEKMEKAGMFNVYFVRGGKKAYGAYLDDLERMKHPGKKDAAGGCVP